MQMQRRLSHVFSSFPLVPKLRFSLVPKLRLEMPIGAKLCFAVAGRPALMARHPSHPLTPRRVFD